MSAAIKEPIESQITHPKPPGLLFCSTRSVCIHFYYICGRGTPYLLTHLVLLTPTRQKIFFFAMVALDLTINEPDKIFFHWPFDALLDLIHVISYAPHNCCSSCSFVIFTFIHNPVPVSMGPPLLNIFLDNGRSTLHIFLHILQLHIMC